MKKVIFNLILLFIFLSLTSCSYSLNIDTKLFVSGIGIDVNDDGDFYLSFAYPDISEFSPESAKIKSAGSVYGFGKTFYEGVEDIISKSSKSIDFEHIKVLTLSSKIFNDHRKFKEIIDCLSINPQISRRIYVCIGDGNARDYVDFKNNSEEDSQIFIRELLEYNFKENGIKTVTLNDLVDSFSQNKTILIPVLKLNDDKNIMKMNGSYVFYNYKFLEDLNLNDSSIINFLRGESLRFANRFNYNGDSLDFECQNIKKKAEFLNYENVILNFDFKTKIKTTPSNENMNEGFVMEAKNILDNDIHRNCLNLVNRFYKDGVDILNFENHFYKFKLKEWRDNIKGNSFWMSRIYIDIKINNNIVNIGNISF